MSQAGTRAVRDNNYPEKLEKALSQSAELNHASLCSPTLRSVKLEHPHIHARTHTHTHTHTHAHTHSHARSPTYPRTQAHSRSPMLAHTHTHSFITTDTTWNRPRAARARDGARPYRPVCARAPTHLPPAPLRGAGVCKSVLWPLNHTHMHAVLHSRTWLGCSVAHTHAQSVTLTHRVRD